MITLSGGVHWNFQKQNAFNLVQNLTGIKSVINIISVKPSIKIDTSKVKERIISEFERYSRLDANKIEVIVVGSKIILKGKARSFNR